MTEALSQNHPLGLKSRRQVINQNIPARKPGRRPPKTLPSDPFEPVTVDYPAKGLLRHDDAEPGSLLVVAAMSDEEIRSGNFFAGRNQLAKNFFLAKTRVSGKFFASRSLIHTGAMRRHFLYAVFAKLLRPLARRRFSTFCPAVVSLRLRKPCLRFALVLLGWNVLFIAMTSSLLAGECVESRAVKNIFAIFSQRQKKFVSIPMVYHFHQKSSCQKGCGKLKTAFLLPQKIFRNGIFSAPKKQRALWKFFRRRSRSRCFQVKSLFSFWIPTHSKTKVVGRGRHGFFRGRNDKSFLTRRDRLSARHISGKASFTVFGEKIIPELAMLAFDALCKFRAIGPRIYF